MMKNKSAFFTILLAGLATLSFAADHAVILQYHNFSADTPRLTSLTLDEFEAHLDYLRDNGFSIRPLAAIIDSLQSGGPLPDKCVAITVDDAYHNLLDGAFQLMRSRGVPCTVFVPTGAVDKAYGDYLSWDEMRMMQAGGFTFASHGHDHLYMVERLPGEDRKAWLGRIALDITHSLERLDAELGTRPRFFAYPYGEFSLELMDQIREMGLIAFGQQSGPIWTDSDFRALPRFPASGIYSSLGTLQDKLLSLPMPVMITDPRNPLTRTARPVLKIRLRPGDYRLETLSAFITGQGRVPVKWVDRDSLTFEVTAVSPLAKGRNRYNITMESDQAGRYMWYSHPWLYQSTVPGDTYR